MPQMIWKVVSCDSEGTEEVPYGFIVRISCLLTLIPEARPTTVARTKAINCMFESLS